MLLAFTSGIAVLYEVKAMESRQIYSPAIFICSRHPLAFGAIKKLLISAMYEVRMFEQIPTNPLEGQNRLLILDTCSVKNWTKIAIEWNRTGGRSIVLTQKRFGSPEEESRFIYLGIHAIILAPNIDTDLPSAVHAVAEGRFWMGRECLSEYIKRTRSFGRFAQPRSFTDREQQIIPFLVTGFSNKDIANMLQIEVRTVKFHVSNILRKFKVKTRKDLRMADTGEEPLAGTAVA
ncbi:MAG: LuxR C-terminal-related transcriptional regulator [Acidobacteriia bacterium]|nr:LuxR C-terminal-related transcriptional regulator [Terriglobia bacterium]